MNIVLGLILMALSFSSYSGYECRTDAFGVIICILDDGTQMRCQTDINGVTHCTG